MKKQIRRGVFETNSSSVHSLTMCMESDYDRWQKDNLYLFRGSGWCYPDNNKPETNHFYTREEAIEFEKTDKYVREDINWTDEEEVNEILHENEFYDYEYFWNEYCEYYETFEEITTTPNGERVVAFGYYGHD
mgnify:FL=1